MKRFGAGGGASMVDPGRARDAQAFDVAGGLGGFFRTFGVFFKPEENRVYFDDGTSQELGERQQKLLQSQEIRPYEIEQGLIE